MIKKVFQNLQKNFLSYILRYKLLYFYYIPMAWWDTNTTWTIDNNESVGSSNNFNMKVDVAWPAAKQTILTNQVKEAELKDNITDPESVGFFWALDGIVSKVKKSLTKVFAMNDAEVNQAVAEVKSKYLITNLPIIGSIASLGAVFADKFVKKKWKDKQVNGLLKMFGKQEWQSIGNFLLGSIDIKLKKFANWFAKSLWLSALPFEDVLGTSWSDIVLGSQWAFTPIVSEEVKKVEKLPEEKWDIEKWLYPSTATVKQIETKLGLGDLTIDSTLQWTNNTNKEEYKKSRANILKKLGNSAPVLCLLEDINTSNWWTNNHTTTWKNPFAIEQGTDRQGNTYDEWIKQSDNTIKYRRCRLFLSIAESYYHYNKTFTDGVNKDITKIPPKDGKIDRVAQIKGKYTDATTQEKLIKQVNDLQLYKNFPASQGEYDLVNKKYIVPTTHTTSTTNDITPHA